MSKWSLWSVIATCLLVPSLLAAEPRGLSNNNPGNIVDNNINWKGQVECDDPRFACFEASTYGIRAMVGVLIAYQDRHGITKIDDIIARWAPEPKNNVRGITRTIRQLAGETKEVTNENLHELIDWIITMENGKNPYPEEYLKEVVDVSLRDFDNPRLYYHFGFHEVQSETVGHETSRNRDGDQEGRTATQAEDNQEPRLPMDTKNDSFSSSFLHHCHSQDCRSLWFDRCYSNLWVDRSSRMVDIRYRRLDMEDSGRVRDHSIGYPLDECHRWSVLR